MVRMSRGLFDVTKLEFIVEKFSCACLNRLIVYCSSDKGHETFSLFTDTVPLDFPPMCTRRTEKFADPYDTVMHSVASIRETRRDFINGTHFLRLTIVIGDYTGESSASFDLDMFSKERL